MVKRSLRNRAKTSEFQKGIHAPVMITNVDIEDRKGANGPINKMIYIKVAQMLDDKKVAESEISWWKPDVTSEYFKTNLQELCLQLHNVLEAYIGEDKAFEAFSTVFDFLGLDDYKEIESRKWKQSEISILFTNLKKSFIDAISPYINRADCPVYLKLTTNYKGEDVEIPKYGKFIEPMSVGETKLKFTLAELKTHTKAGNMEVANTSTVASSSNGSATI